MHIIYENPRSNLAAFRAAIEAAGLLVPDNVMPDGRLHRFPTNGKSSDDSGWYVLYLDGVAAGAFGCWRTGVSEKWCAKSDRDLSKTERSDLRHRMREAMAARDAERERVQDAAADTARDIWCQADPAGADHPYLQRKCIAPHKARIKDGQLVVPMYRPDGRLSSLQFISADGSKIYSSDAKAAGCHFLLNGDPSRLFIAEGFATACSIAEATGASVAVAFSAGQLPSVTRTLKDKFPNAEIVIAADNDVRDDGTENTGVVKATEAAAAVGARLVVPDLDGRKCDFNDLHVALGLDAVRAQLQAAATAGPEATDTDALVADLAKLDRIAYGQRRKEAAQRLGVSVVDVDAAVKQARRQGEEAEAKLLFPVIEPVTEPVDGNELINEVAAQIRRYVFLSDHAATAAALWVLHTYAVPAAYVAPILCVTSPQKRCGKTQLLKLLSTLVHRGLLTENFSLAALYRVMDEYRPTLLIDEADAFIDQQDEIRGIINSGHSRGSCTIRVSGENRDQIEVFDSFGPKAVAGIGKRRDTITDRSIIIEMQRRTRDETVEQMRLDRLDYRQLQSRCAGWAAQNLDALKAADPAVPAVLHDRAQDNWRPLFAIAELTGWRDQAERAAVALTGIDDSDTVGVMLLEDIRRLFAAKDVDRMASADIAAALAELEERPWPEWGKNRKPITQNQVARLLAPFKVSPKPVRFHSKTWRGYLLEQFSDPFRRYLSSFAPESAFQTVTPQQVNDGAGCSPIQSVTPDVAVTVQSVTVTDRVTDEISPEPNGGADCYGVTVQNPEIGEEEKEEAHPPTNDGTEYVL